MCPSCSEVQSCKRVKISSDVYEMLCFQRWLWRLFSLRCDTGQLGRQLSLFRRCLLPHINVEDELYLKDRDRSFLRNVRTCLSNYTVLHKTVIFFLICLWNKHLNVLACFKCLVTRSHILDNRCSVSCLKFEIFYVYLLSTFRNWTEYSINIMTLKRQKMLPLVTFIPLESL